MNVYCLVFSYFLFSSFFFTPYSPPLPFSSSLTRRVYRIACGNISNAKAYIELRLAAYRPISSSLTRRVYRIADGNISNAKAYIELRLAAYRLNFSFSHPKGISNCRWQYIERESVYRAAFSSISTPIFSPRFDSITTSVICKYGYG